MSIEGLRQWHWAVIGLIAGLLFGWAWNSFNQSGGLEAARTIDPRRFEEALKRPPLRGYPWVKNLRLHQDQGHYVLTMKQLQVDPAEKHPENARHYLYVPVRLNGGPPYLPETASQTVRVVVDPASGWPNTLQINGNPSYSNSLLKLDRWQLGQSTIQPGTAAEIGLVLRPAEYRLSIFADPAMQSAVSMKGLSIKFNGRQLAPLSRRRSSAKEVWQTTVPRDAFIGGDWQTFQFNDNSHSMRIRRIELEDPRYTVLDYLDFARRGNPQLSWGMAWWDRPALAIPAFGAAGLVLIGVIWPLVLRLLIGAGFGRRLPEVQYDLDRFQREPTPASPADVKTDSAMAQLLELEKRMEQELESAPAAPAASTIKAACEAPPQLANRSDSPIGLTQPAPETNHEYSGEYYPVDRRAK